MVGDSNIHIDDVSCSFAADFLNVTESFHFIQHVSGPTHTGGHTLDLVFTLGLNIDSICSEELYVTDHECVLCNLSFNSDSLPSKCVKCSRISAEKFSAAFVPSAVLSSHADVTHLDLFPLSIHHPG